MSYIYVYVATNGRTAYEGKNNSYGKPRPWTRWTKTERKLKMGRNLVEGTHRIQFILRSVYDLLPTLTNLYK